MEQNNKVVVDRAQQRLVEQILSVFMDSAQQRLVVDRAQQRLVDQILSAFMDRAQQRLVVDRTQQPLMEQILSVFKDCAQQRFVVDRAQERVVEQILSVFKAVSLDSAQQRLVVDRAHLRLVSVLKAVPKDRVQQLRVEVFKAIFRDAVQHQLVEVFKIIAQYSVQRPYGGRSQNFLAGQSSATARGGGGPSTSPQGFLDSGMRDGGVVDDDTPRAESSLFSVEGGGSSTDGMEAVCVHAEFRPMRLCRYIGVGKCFKGNAGTFAHGWAELHPDSLEWS